MKVVALLLALSASNASSTEVEFGRRPRPPPINKVACSRRCRDFYTGNQEGIDNCISRCRRSDLKGGSLRGATNLSSLANDAESFVESSRRFADYDYDDDDDEVNN